MRIFEDLLISKDIETDRREIENLRRIRLYKDDSWNPFFTGVLIVAHLIGVFLNYWDISFGFFMGVVLYRAMFHYFQRILTKIDINTLELNIILLNEIDDIRKRL